MYLQSIKCGTKIYDFVDVGKKTLSIFHFYREGKNKSVSLKVARKFRRRELCQKCHTQTQKLHSSFLEKVPLIIHEHR